jgi:hypothetical protein
MEPGIFIPAFTETNRAICWMRNVVILLDILHRVANFKQRVYLLGSWMFVFLTFARSHSVRYRRTTSGLRTPNALEMDVCRIQVYSCATVNS